MTAYTRRYVALAFIIVGTLVDLFPEVMLLTEVILHPGVLYDRSAARKVASLLCSDGKPIVAFAASTNEVGILEVVRTSLRGRLFRLGRFHFSIYNDNVGDDGLKTTRYSSFLGCLAAGELLTAAGGAILLVIDFGWLALACVVSSLFAFLASTRRTMIAVGRRELVFEEAHFDLLASVVPGPVSFLKFILCVPVWPMSLVMLDIFRNEPSGDHYWVSPLSWLGVTGPSVERMLDWVVSPYLVMTWVVAFLESVALTMILIAGAGALLFSVGVFFCLAVWSIVNGVVFCVLSLWRWYFAITIVDNKDESDDKEESNISKASRQYCEAVNHRCTSIRAEVHKVDGPTWLWLCESGCGNVLSWLMYWLDTRFVCCAVFLAGVLLFAAVSMEGSDEYNCGEQKWAFASAHVSWFLVVFFFKVGFENNPFHH